MLEAKRMKKGDYQDLLLEVVEKRQTCTTTVHSLLQQITQLKIMKLDIERKTQSDALENLSLPHPTSQISDSIFVTKTEGKYKDISELKREVAKQIQKMKISYNLSMCPIAQKIREL